MRVQLFTSNSQQDKGIFSILSATPVKNNINTDTVATVPISAHAFLLLDGERHQC